MITSTLLELKNIEVTDHFRRRLIIEGLSLTVALSEIVCLIGPSGSGKTVTAMTAAGILPDTLIQTGGTIHYKGRDVTSQQRIPANEGIIYLLQEAGQSFNPLLPVGPQIADPILLINPEIDDSQVHLHTVNALQFVGLEDAERIFQAYSCELSNGQLQRCAIASALLVEADLIIADEPTASLDQASRQSVLEAFKKLQCDKGTALLIISHDRYLAETLEARQVFMPHAIEKLELDTTGRLGNIESSQRALKTKNEILQVRNLTKTFPPTQRGRKPLLVFDDLSFKVRAGEFLGLAGPSGSGKSTLAKCLMHLCEYDSGEIWFRGETIPRKLRPQDCSQLGMRMIWQDPYSAANPLMSAGQLIHEGITSNSRHDSDNVELNVRQMFSRVGLREDVWKRRPITLSGGELKRVLTVQALVGNPYLIIADEPTDFLDSESAKWVIEYLMELLSTNGCGGLLISHDEKLLNSLCSDVVRLEID